jgi:23S rRNA (cytosine1962-C5)-methyltransferase
MRDYFAFTASLVVMTHSARLVLNKGARHRILTGHPWVFASEVERLEGPAEDGGTVEIRSARGESLGSAIYNSRSQIVARRYATDLVPLDEKLLAARIDGALAYRESLRKTDARGMAQRLVWSESDQLPGLIADRYDDVLVLQTLTLAMSKREAIIADLLRRRTGCRVCWRATMRPCGNSRACRWSAPCCTASTRRRRG